MIGLSRAWKVTIIVSVVVAVLAASGVGIWAIFRDKGDTIVIDPGYGSSVYPLQEGEKYTAQSNYTADELFGRLNWKFAQHTNWYSEYTGQVDTLVKQEVHTYKQFADGVLISADITTSSMVNVARQFCYVPQQDRVVWREAAGGASTYNGINTPWDDGAPLGNININYHEDLNNNGKLDDGEDLNGNGKLEVGFKATCGLPATELSVYVIDSQTILSSQVDDNGDGTFTLRLSLDPNLYTQEDGSTRGATTYYCKQMRFTGGLTDMPTFESINVTYTFDSDFNTVRSSVEESYNATMGFTVACTSTSQTTYEYDTPKALSDAYESYFKQYVAMDADSGPIQKELTSADCLAQAFAPLMTSANALNVNLTIDSRPLQGVVYLDLHSGEQIDLSKVEVRASIGDFSLWLDNGTAYLLADKYKVSMTTEELLGLVAPQTETAAASIGEDTDILAQLAGGTFVVDEDNGKATLEAEISLESLTIPLHFTFNVDENNNVSLRKVTTSLQLDGMPVDAELSFAKTDAAPKALSDADKTAFVQLDNYVDSIYQLATAQVLHADLAYKTADIDVDGSFDIDPATKQVVGALDVAYQKISKTVKFGYKDDVVYADLDGARVRLTVDDAITMISNYLPVSELPAMPQLDIANLLGVLFNDLVTKQIDLSEEENKLTVAIHGTELLQAFGVEFDLGDVKLAVGQNTQIEASALGASVCVTVGKTVTVDTADYRDVAPLLVQLPDLLAKQGIAFNGQVNVSANKKSADIAINDGRVSWKNGLGLYLDATLLVGDVQQQVLFKLQNNVATISAAGVSVEARLGELDELSTALFDVYDRLRTTVNELLTDPTINPMPELHSVDDLLQLLEDLGLFTKVAGEAGNTSFDWQQLVQQIELSTPDGEGLIRLSLDNLAVTVATRTDGLADLTVDYTTNSVQVSADLSTSNSDKALPDVPRQNLHLSNDEALSLLSYIGSAIDLMHATDLSLAMDGTTTVTDENGESAKKYDIHAEMATHRGASSLLHIDVDGNNLWVDADVFAHATINVTAANEADKSLYIDLFILDGAPQVDEENKTVYTLKDGMLDFYVVLSQFGPVGSDNPNYEPVRLYAPSQEILRLLSSALPMMGVDAEILNNYMINKWLTMTQVSQLKAFGGVLSSLLPSGNGDSNGDDATAAVPAAIGSDGFDLGKYLTQLTINGEELTVSLNSQTLFGKTGLQDVQATLTKLPDAHGDNGTAYGRLTSLDLLNIYGADGTENTSLRGTVDYSPVSTSMPEGTYRSFLEADRLLLALANSATHGVAEDDSVITGEQTPHHYAPNNYFYIDGSITAKIILVPNPIEIRLIALSLTIDENGDLGVNVRLEYDGMAAAINGDSTVDITIKSGMVYMKRVQTTEFRIVERALDTPITLYRVMPLDSFTGDILNQVGFILNFDSTIMNLINQNAGGGETTPTEEVDFGRRLDDVLIDYTFTDAVTDEEGNSTPATWNLTLNGDALVKGVLGDIVITISADENGFIRGITAHTTVVSVITADLDLNWRNPGGVMEETVTDQTNDIADEVTSGFGDMLNKLNEEHGWLTTLPDGTTTGTRFLEGRQVELRYVLHALDGTVTTLGTQTVIVSTGNDGNPANTLYTNLVYPSLEDYADTTKCSTSWVEGAPKAAGDAWDGQPVCAHQQVTMYNVTFRSDKKLGEDWQWDEASELYVYTCEMEYGATVTIGNTDYTVTDQLLSFDVLTKDVPPLEGGQRAGHWQQDPAITTTTAVFTAEYDPDTIGFTSVVAFSLDGQDAQDVDGKFVLSVDYGTTYIVPQPTAEGYTFLGWFVKEGDSWTRLPDTLELGESTTKTVAEALWAQDGFVTLETTKSSSWGTETYTAKAGVEFTNLVGAWASEVRDKSATCSFAFDTEAVSSEATKYRDPKQVNEKDTESRNFLQSKYTYAHVKVEITYTLTDGTEFVITITQDAKL